MQTEEYFDLGTYSRPLPEVPESVQTWVDRGLVWAFAFNHEEAVACFERALAQQPGIALAHWGIAYCVGPNYNKGWDAFDPVDFAASLDRAHAHLRLAAEAVDAGRGTPVEAALVEALAARFAGVDPDDEATWAPAHAVYGDAMAAVAERFPLDVDVLALAADALLNVTAWALWDPLTGAPAEGSRAVEAERLLDAALALPGGQTHPFVLHLHIHLLEMSDRPEDAVPSADLLRGLVPGAGHLQHMPSHIDVLCGDYQASVTANRLAVRADRLFLEREGPVNFYALYRAHDLHFVVYSAMFQARFADAITAADELADQLTPDLLSVQSPPMADWLEAFVPLRVHVLVRFGRWDVLATEPLPQDRELYATTTAMVLYGRALAHAALGDLDAAAAVREEFEAARAAVPESRYLFNNTARDILAVAAAMLDGEIAYRQGKFEEAFALLREAVALDDGLPYDEPWGWMQPTRHAYGALLLEQGRVEDAAAVYAADLGLDPTVSRSVHHPRNVWALHGYHECLQRLGRDAEARLVQQQLRLATARADVPVLASCACRLEAFAGPRHGDHGCH